MKKILVPVDGSDLSLFVVEQALEQAKAQESQVTLLTVIPEDRIYFGGVMQFEQSKAMIDAQKTMYEESKKDSTKMLDILSQKFTENNIPVEKSLKTGIPADEILKTAESGQYDLIVIGNRGFSPAKRFLLGSVSQRVLSGAHCPVLVAKKH